MSNKSFLQFLTNKKQWEIILDYWHPVNHPTRRKLDKIVTKTLKQLGRPYYLSQLALQAILLGMASWVYEPITYIDSDSDNDGPSIAILVNPRTTYPEVETALKQIKNTVFKNYKLPSYVPHVFEYGFWYWEKIRGKKYIEISQNWSNNKNEQLEKIQSINPNYTATKSEVYGIDATEVDIIKGVKKYASLLDF